MAEGFLSRVSRTVRLERSGGAGVTKLISRRAECGMLDRLVDAVCAGQSRALVLSGDAGVGKTVLLQHVVSRAAKCRVVQVAGVESEMELWYCRTGTPRLTSAAKT